VCFHHVFIETSNLICTILAFNIITININMSSSFPNEYISGPLQDQANTKIRIILFLLQTRLNKSNLQSNSTPLLNRHLLSHYLHYTYLTEHQLLLRHQILLQLLILLHRPFKGHCNLLTPLNNLFPEQFIFNPTILIPHQ